MDKALAARAAFSEVADALRAHFEVEAHADDTVRTQAQRIERG